MDIMGHGHRRIMLRDIARGDLPHHAFLFSGPDGIGKRLVAKEFAAELLGCPGEDPSRKQDFLFIEPLAKTGTRTKSGGKRKEPKKGIFVDVIREMETFLSRFPAESARRVVLIDDADRMNEEAQNALLKTLEEPNSTSVLILVTARTGRLFDTILSRTFRVPFSSVPADVIRNGMSGAFPDTTLEPFFYTLGRPGLAVSAATDSEGFAGRRETLRFLFSLSTRSFSERIALAETLSERPSETIVLFEWWVSGLRNMWKPERSVKESVSYYRLLGDIERTIRSLRETNANARLLIDRLFLVSF